MRASALQGLGDAALPRTSGCAALTLQVW